MSLVLEVFEMNPLFRWKACILAIQMSCKYNVRYTYTHNAYNIHTDTDTKKQKQKHMNTTISLEF